MQPIGPLMHEHRLIERMLGILEKEKSRIQEDQAADTQLIDQSVDFFRTFADRCHHGKEEDILFRDLKNKSISKEHQVIMDELIEEHILGRRLVTELDGFNNHLVRSGNGSVNKEIAGTIDKLLNFYSKHIKKEDEDFFHPVMAYFSKEEMSGMLQEFDAFEKELLHEKYLGMIRKLEENPVS